MKSDVFESFVKIAQEKGMISMESDETKKKLEKTHRADSLDISDIEALYGVKPNLPKDMEYENNIMECAHPNSVVVSPSYDKLNGLVENDIERQNISVHIVHKTPDGLLTQRKYAEKDLVLSLVRIANDLDNKDQEQLRVLADLCLCQASQAPLKKEAWVVPVLIGAAALLGGIYLKNHMRFISDGFEKDHQKLLAEIDDLIESNSSTQTQLGGGYTYKPEFLRLMQDFRNKLNAYFNLYRRIAPLIDQLEKPRTATELLDLAQQPETTDIIKAYRAFRSATDELLPYITKIMSDFDNEGYKQRQIAEKGMFMTLVDAPQVFHGGKGLVADDFDDVHHALRTYVMDIQNIMKALETAESIEKAASQEMQQAAYKSQELFGPGAGGSGGETATPADKSPGTFVSSPKSVQDVDREAGELSALLEGSGLGI